MARFRRDSGREPQRRDEHRINERIRGVRACRLIDSDGTQLGIFGIRDALDRAQEAGLDLVEIAPKSQPPVCRIMDYSKYRYDQQQKEKAQRKAQKQQQQKQMKFRCNIGDGDYETKKNGIVKFLSSGNSVKITIMFRGRELSHPEQGLDILGRLADDLSDIAIVTQKPNLEGRDMTMVLFPSEKTKKKAAAESTDA